MILEYHQIGAPEERWQRTPEHFRQDLQRLYDQGYRLLSLRDFVRNQITTPAGFTPVVLTFDDASPGQFRYLDRGGQESLDPNCAVGLLQAFAQDHPDFGLEATFFVLWDRAFGTPQDMDRKVQHLIELGLDIGNHTWGHANLRELDAAGLRKQLGRSVKRARKALPDYPFDLLALPHGAIPRNEAGLAKGEYEGTSYRHRAAVLVGAEPAPVPVDVAYRSLRLPRIQATQPELDKWFGYFEKHPEERFISDGDPDVITVPESDRYRVDANRLWGRRLNVLPSGGLSVGRDGGGRRPAPHQLLGKKVDNPQVQRPVWAKGLYVTGWVAGTQKRMGELIQLVDRTELNAMVIDVKDSDGRVGYPTDVPLAREVGAIQKRVSNVEAVLARLRKYRIYPIARIVVFKDNVLPRQKPEWAVQRPDGSLWQDRTKCTWSDPYNEKVWDYHIDLALDAAQRGFREVQFDYVRFPSDGSVSECVFPRQDGRTPAEVIGQFVARARERLEPQGVFVAADLLGLTGLVRHDLGIGQVVGAVAPHLDYLCPMVYPSHYARGEYGLQIPDLEPYRIVFYSLRDASEKLRGSRCQLRPWLQAFSLHGYPYGPAELRAQIDAVNAAGFSQWLLWHPRCRYTDVQGALRPAVRQGKLKGTKGN